MEPRISIVTLLVCLVLGCANPIEPPPLPETRVTGATMGTSYHITLIADLDSTVELKSDIDAELERINSLMSTYDPESEISKFNKHSSADPFEISPDTMTVTRAAYDLFRSTGGVFDPTVGPLIELWGFGSKGRRMEPPSEAEIQTAKNLVGMDRVEIGDETLSKREAGLRLDYSAIAKGFAVDRVAALLGSKGFSHRMVEIGGEIAVAGRNKNGVPWRLGVDSPKQVPGKRTLAHTLSLTDGGLATSGDYRNNFEYEGVVYSHVLDPTTGWPIPESVKSVSVVANDCMTSDGAATAIMALGAEKGLAWATKEEGVEALLMVKSATGEISESMTPGMKAYLLD